MRFAYVKRARRRLRNDEFPALVKGEIICKQVEALVWEVDVI
jgi:hypothetical protein